MHLQGSNFYIWTGKHSTVAVAVVAVVAAAVVAVAAAAVVAAAAA